MAGFQPFDYGNAILKAEQINNAQMKNAIAQRDLQLGTAGLKNSGTYNPRDYTTESWNQAIDPRSGRIIDPTKLVRYLEPKQDRIVVINGVPTKVSTTPGTSTQAPLTTLQDQAAGAGTIKENEAFGSQKGTQQGLETYGPAATTAVDQAAQDVLTKNVPPREREISRQRKIGGAEGQVIADKPKAQRRVAARKAQFNNLTRTITKAKSQVSKLSAGFIGNMTQGVAGSPAVDLAETLQTLKANAGFDKLQEMRENSPTGGALGQVAVQELQALQAVWTSLEQRQSPQQLRENLVAFEKQVNESWQRISDAYLQDYGEQWDGSDTDAKQTGKTENLPMGDPELFEFLSEEDRTLFQWPQN